MILVDTNILIRIANPADPLNQSAVDAVDAVVTRGYRPYIVPQVVYEFWVVATRPLERNGLVLSADEAASYLDSITDQFPLLIDESGVFETWQSLVTSRKICGKAAHDVRLVAAMLRHGITHILTFNEQDFSRFSQIVVVSPPAAGNLPLASP